MCAGAEPPISGIEEVDPTNLEEDILPEEEDRSQPPSTPPGTPGTLLLLLDCRKPSPQKEFCILLYCKARRQSKGTSTNSNVAEARCSLNHSNGSTSPIRSVA
jgi:hypothetical protein